MGFLYPLLLLPARISFQVWTCAGAVHAAAVSVSSYMHQLCSVWKTQLLDITHHLCLLLSFLLLCCIDPWGLEGGFDEGIPLGLSSPKSVIVFTWARVCFCVKDSCKLTLHHQTITQLPLKGENFFVLFRFAVKDVCWRWENTYKQQTHKEKTLCEVEGGLGKSKHLVF